MAYDWPGNVRELENVIERSVLLSGKRPEILAEDFPEDMLKNLHLDNPRLESSPSTGPVNLAKMEDEHIKTVLASVGGNKSEAARLLGISRKKLYSKIRKDKRLSHARFTPSQGGSLEAKKRA
jgi:transcriptional regulator with PAS, ATPase and Fis domain